ncbi:MAG TPA: biliverdin-producing heme oxygenase [Chitinophagaceae bacterium]|nr:biliverdin-producing heme oxygenase [Chitinophagaceae bacterium]
MLLDDIRQATRQYHQELDHEVFQLIKQVKNPADYKKLLQVLYGYYKPLYSLLNLYLPDATVPDYNLRRKPDLMLDDLYCFPGGVIHITFCANIPGISNASRAIGVFYVLEGSTMGGQVISKKIAGNIGLTVSYGFSFLSGYGERNTQMWNNFLNALNNNGNKYKAEELIAAATEAFSKLKTWINHCYAETAVNC